MRPGWLFWAGYVFAIIGLALLHIGLAVFVQGVMCMVYAWFYRHD